MIRRFLVTAIVLCVAGCQAPGPRVQLSPEHAKKLKMALSGPAAADRSGSLYLATPSTLMRYDPGKDRMTNVLNDSCPDIRDVAVTDDGVVLVLRPRELSAYAGGYVVTLYPLPDEAIALSCDRGFAYVLTQRGEGARLLRIHLTGKTKGSVDTILTTEDRPRALCAVRGGCLVASGGNIVKVTDPVPGQDNAGEMEVATALLVALQEPVTSVAADQSRKIVYFATADMTYAWIKGQVVSVFPAGSRLAFAKDTLTICLPSGLASQVIQISAVSQHTETLLKALAESKPTKRRSAGSRKR